MEATRAAIILDVLRSKGQLTGCDIKPASAEAFRHPTRVVVVIIRKPEKRSSVHTAGNLSYYRTAGNWSYYYTAGCLSYDLRMCSNAQSPSKATTRCFPTSIFVFAAAEAALVKACSAAAAVAGSVQS